MGGEFSPDCPSKPGVKGRRVTFQVAVKDCPQQVVHLWDSTDASEEEGRLEREGVVAKEFVKLIVGLEHLL